MQPTENRWILDRYQSGAPVKGEKMYVLIIVSLISGGFTTTTLQEFSSQATCLNAANSIQSLNQSLGTKSGVYLTSCVSR
jgi:hypothetical protein